MIVNQLKKIIVKKIIIITLIIISIVALNVIRSYTEAISSGISVSVGNDVMSGNTSTTMGIAQQNALSSSLLIGRTISIVALIIFSSIFMIDTGFDIYNYFEKENKE